MYPFVLIEEMNRELCRKAYGARQLQRSRVAEWLERRSDEPTVRHASDLMNILYPPALHRMRDEGAGREMTAAMTAVKRRDE